MAILEGAGWAVLGQGGEAHNRVRALRHRLDAAVVVEIGSGKPGSAAFTRMPTSALAYCTDSIVSAALVGGRPAELPRLAGLNRPGPPARSGSGRQFRHRPEGDAEVAERCPVHDRGTAGSYRRLVAVVL
jgi:hypothetical protein